MVKYFEIKTEEGLIYYKAPSFIKSKYFKSYAANTRIRPKIKFLLDYYGFDNINIIETDERVTVLKYPSQVSVNVIRKKQVISYNIITKEVEVVLDESKKTFINRYCLEGLLLYFTKAEFYDNPNSRNKIAKIKEQFILRFLEKRDLLNFSDAEINLGSDNNLYLTATITKN